MFGPSFREKNILFQSNWFKNCTHPTWCILIRRCAQKVLTVSIVNIFCGQNNLTTIRLNTFCDFFFIYNVVWSLYLRLHSRMCTYTFNVRTLKVKTLHYKIEEIKHFCTYIGLINSPAWQLLQLIIDNLLWQISEINVPYVWNAYIVIYHITIDLFTPNRSNYQWL